MPDMGGSSGGYDEAAKIIAQATREATAVQKSAYEKNLEAMYPWLAMGKTALGTYGNLLGLPVSDLNYPSSFALGGTPSYGAGSMFGATSTPGAPLYPAPGAGGGQIFGGIPAVSDSTAYIRQTPGYQFEEQQGLNALGRYASARGLDYSGAQMRGVTGYGQSLADKYYNQYMNQLAGLYGAGQTGANQVGTAGVQTGQNIANTTMSGANALAQAAIGSSQAQSASSQNLFNNILGGGLLGYATGGFGLGGLFGGGGVNPFTGAWG